MNARTSPVSADLLPLAEQVELLSHARTLLRGGAAPTLRGSKLALLSDDPDSPAAQLFCQAASALGGHVAKVRSGLSETSPPSTVRDTARMLGRLYDAVECQGLARSVVDCLRDLSGVPVFDGCAGAEHPTALLVMQVDGDAAWADKRAALLQAQLLRSMARAR